MTVHEGERELAEFATRAAEGGDREHEEPDDPFRSPFELDAHRIVCCTAFRRLEHKTQVFAPDAHDHFRTRLTHTLEASRLARCLARALRGNELLAEAVVLAHDLGHPPFGHAGEKALAEAMEAWGGFNHNAHSLRVVTFLEHPFPRFRGLNLTRATLAGLAGHETRYDRAAEERTGYELESEPAAPAVSTALSGERRKAPGEATHVGGEPLPTSIEAQIGSMADRLAYNIHDLEDAIGAELVDGAALEGLSIWKRYREEAGWSSAGQRVHAVRRVVLDGMIARLASDLVRTSRRGLEATGMANRGVAGRESDGSDSRPQDGRRAAISLSEEAEAELSQVEEFLIERVYRHPRIAASDVQGREMILSLFAAYRRAPSALPERFRARIESQGLEVVIRDYIAGMTDRYCRAECERLTRRLV